MSLAPSPQVGGKRRRGLVVICSVAVVVAGSAIGLVVWIKTAPPAPPAVSLDGLDPEAVELLTEARAAVVKSPRSAPAWAKLGMIYFAFGYANESGICLHWAGVRDPKNPRWPYLEALTALDKPDRCLPLLARAVQLAPDEPVPRLRNGEMLLEQGRLDDAEAEFGRVLDREPDNPRGHLDLGRLYYQRNDLTAARDHLERSAKHASRVRATHALLAEVYGRLNDAAGVEREQTRMADSVDGLPWHDPYQEEVDQYRVGAKAQLDHVDGLFKQGRANEALALLSEFVRNHPESQAAHASLGRLLVFQRNYADAEQAFRAAVRLNPDLVGPQCELGAVLQRRGAYAEAADHYRRAMQSKPMHARAHYQLAGCLVHLGNKKDAAQSYRDAIRCKPDFADAHRELGRLLAESGDNEEARKELELAVNLASADETARKLLEGLPEKP